MARWASNKCCVVGKTPNPKNIVDVMGEMLYKIRLPLLSSDEFIINVYPENLIPEYQCLALRRFFFPPHDPLGWGFPFSSIPRKPFKATGGASNSVGKRNADSYSDRDSQFARKRTKLTLCGEEDIKLEPEDDEIERTFIKVEPNIESCDPYDSDDSSVIFIPIPPKTHPVIDLEIYNDQATIPSTSQLSIKEITEYEDARRLSHGSSCISDQSEKTQLIPWESPVQKQILTVDDALEPEGRLVIVEEPEPLKDYNHGLGTESGAVKEISTEPPDWPSQHCISPQDQKAKRRNRLSSPEEGELEADESYLDPPLPGKVSTMEVLAPQQQLDMQIQKKKPPLVNLKINQPLKKSSTKQPSLDFLSVGKGIDLLQRAAQLPVWPTTTADAPMEIGAFMHQLRMFPKLECIKELEVHLLVSDTSTFNDTKVLLPNIKDFRMHLTFPINPALNPEAQASRFRLVSRKIFDSPDCFKRLIFVKGESKSGPFRRIWDCELKILITLNGVKILESGWENSDSATKNRCVSCSLVPFNVRMHMSVLSGYTDDCGPHKFTLVGSNLDIRSYLYMATHALEKLSILKIHSFDGVKKFIRSCPNLKELRIDARTFGPIIMAARESNAVIPSKSQTLFLDDDLDLFSGAGKLKKLVVSEMNIGIRNPSNANRYCHVTSPVFFLCEFDPVVLKYFERLFPNTKEIHVRKYENFVKKILNMNRIEKVVIWGQPHRKNIYKIADEMPSVATGNVYDNVVQKQVKVMLNHVELDANGRISGYDPAFILTKIPPLGLRKDIGDCNRYWKVAKFGKLPFGARVFFKFAYDAFDYGSVMDFESFLIHFKQCYY
jgi:hypothetical protein